MGMEPEYRQLVEEFAKQHYPKVFDLPRLTVWLELRGMLYLSTGWFCEVLSFGPTLPSITDVFPPSPTITTI